jgi:riboflavin biosynthesis pyrimidine reductase
VRQIYPGPGAAIPGGESDEDLLARLYAYPPGCGPGSPWVRANMVASVDGAASVQGRSGGLGGPADRLLFQLLRSLADVVVVGASTARAEKYKPARASAMTARLREGRPATPPIAVVSASLDLDPGSPLFADAPGHARTIVLTTSSAPAGRRAALQATATVLEAGAEQVETGKAITALAELGHGRILTEGGPALLAQIAADGLLDELCLTVSPVLAGGHSRRILAATPGTPPLPGAPQPLELAHVVADDGFLLCRYLRPR